MTRIKAETTSPIRTQMPTGFVLIGDKTKVTWGPGLRDRERPVADKRSGWGGANDRCFNVAWSRNKGRNWTRVWLGRGLWRVDRIDSGGTW